MALTKPVPRDDAPAASSETPATAAAAAVKPAGTFESMDETTSTKPAANDPPPWQPDPTPAAASAAAPAAAPAAATRAVATTRTNSAFAQEVAEMKGAVDLSYGALPTFKGDNGAIRGTTGAKINLGPWVKVTMMAWDSRVQIAPGSDSDKAKDYVAFSQDGVTIDQVIGEKLQEWVGKPVTAYLNFLKTDADYPEAKKSDYIDIACLVNDGATQAAKGLIGEAIMVTLSQSSIPSFKTYQNSLQLKAKAIEKGGALAAMIKVPQDPFTFYFAAEVATKPGMTWTKLNVVDKQPVAE